MKKLMCHRDYEKEDTLMGVIEEIKWERIDWSGGPKESGEYMVCFKDGDVAKISYANNREDSIKVITEKLDDIFWADNVESLTNDEIVYLLMHVWDLWYDVYEDRDYNRALYIYRTDYGNYPEYYLATPIQGPSEANLKDAEVETVSFCDL